MSAPAFITEFEPRYGELTPVAPLLRRIVCNNASKYTFHGTGTYVIGHGDVAVVDPGPDDHEHVAALLRGLGGETVRHILITHTHGDHSPGARALSDATGAPVLGYGPHPTDARGEGGDDPLAEDHGEHNDVDFAPDAELAHGDVVRGPGYTIEAVHTPGHISNHLCFGIAEENALLTGDHVMGWSTTVIPPPDGDIAAYLDSLRLVLDRADTRLYPTDGAPVTEPAPFVAALLEHRLAREAAIVAQLQAGPRTAVDIVAVLYADVRAELHKPAARSVVAHLRKLHTDGHARPAIPDASTTADETLWELT